jgi:DNA-binding MltR family transcriptional regulator
MRSKFLTFEVADFDSAYNCILGRTFLKKFMAVAHFVYSVLKVSGPRGPITIRGDRKGAIVCDMKTFDMIR